MGHSTSSEAQSFVKIFLKFWNLIYHCKKTKLKSEYFEKLFLVLIWKDCDREKSCAQMNNSSNNSAI